MSLLCIDLCILKTQTSIFHIYESCLKKHSYLRCKHGQKNHDSNFPPALWNTSAQPRPKCFNKGSRSFKTSLLQKQLGCFNSTKTPKWSALHISRIHHIWLAWFCSDCTFENRMISFIWHRLVHAIMLLYLPTALTWYSCQKRIKRPHLST